MFACFRSQGTKLDVASPSLCGPAKGLLDLVVFGQQVRVVHLRSADVIAQLGGNFEQGHPLAGEERSEGFPQHVRVAIGDFLGLQVLIKRSSEIPSIPVFAPNAFGWRT